MASSELTLRRSSGRKGGSALCIFAVVLTALEPLYETSLIGANVGLTLTLFLKSRGKCGGSEVD